MKASAHYNEDYFRMQNAPGEVQGFANLFKFSPHIGDKDRILDFGCGSGALLCAIGSRNGSVIGVEINPSAAKYARAHGQNMLVRTESKSGRLLGRSIAPRLIYSSRITHLSMLKTQLALCEKPIASFDPEEE